MQGFFPSGVRHEIDKNISHIGDVLLERRKMLGGAKDLIPEQKSATFEMLNTAIEALDALQKAIAACDVIWGKRT